MKNKKVEQLKIKSKVVYRDDPNLELDGDYSSEEHFVYDDQLMTLKGLALDIYHDLRSGKLSKYKELAAHEHPNPIFNDLYSITDIEWLPQYCFEDKRIYNAIDKALRYLSDVLRYPYVIHPQELSYESVPSFHFHVINQFQQLLMMFGEFIDEHSLA